MERFLFVGDDLALDFINTRVRVRGRESDLLATPADLDRWWGEAVRHYPELETASEPADVAQLQRLREFRDALREQLSAAVENEGYNPSLITRLNDVLTHSHPQIVDSNGEERMEIRAARSGDRLAVGIALAAARLVTEGQVERLHRCEGCILLFYDRTKSGTRHWCSTQCFDRARAAARRAGVSLSS